MIEDTIAAVGIDDDGRLFVAPSGMSFALIYRAATGVNWDASRRRLFSPPPREWDYSTWFKRIIGAVADEYGARLKLTADTEWSNVSPALKEQITSGSIK